MRKDYFKNILVLGIFVFLAFTFQTSAQGDCDDLVTTPIELQMGLDTQPVGFNVVAGQQDGRIFRDGIPSVCPFKVYPGDFNLGTPYNWTAVAFYASATTCITINFDPDSGVTPCVTNGHAHVYQELGGLNMNPFDPAAQATNFLGDSGLSAIGPFSVEVEEGWFEVVFSNTSAQDNCSVQFTFENNGGAITCEPPLAVADNALQNAIAILPNPAGNVMTLSNSSNVALQTASIYDINGKLMITIDLTDMPQQKAINVSALATGVYMVEIQSENASTVKRLVKL